jgi:pimeloyl-ACP methyl ester carboxylesterase
MAGSTKYLERPGGRIAYQVAGRGPLVVCVPGMGDVRSNFRRLRADLLEAGYRVAAMDLRGHGDSDATFDSYDDVAAAGDVVALVAELGGPAVVIGSSMGGGAAALAAAEAPGAVAGLVLTGPFVREAKMKPGMKLAFRLLLLRPWGPAAWKAFYAKFYPGRPPADLGEHRQRIRESMRKPGHWRAFVRTTRTSHAPVEARLGDVKAPTLVVMGERDPDFPDPVAEAHFIGERLGGDVQLVPDAGHYPHAEYPELVTPAVTAFLARVTSRA